MSSYWSHTKHCVIETKCVFALSNEVINILIILCLRYAHCLVDRCGPPLAFTHIWKTGGMTLDRILRDQAGKNWPIAYGVNLTVLNRNTQEGRRIFQQLLKTRSGHEDYNLLLGHVDYNDQKRWNENASLVTIFRDPVQRIVSQYFYLRNIYHAERFMRHSLEQLVKKGWTPKNVYLDRFNCKNVGCVQQKLEDDYVWFGVLEWWDLSMQLLKHSCKRWVHDVLNGTKINQATRSNFSESILLKIASRISKDIEVYNMAKNLFHKRLHSAGIIS